MKSLIKLLCVVAFLAGSTSSWASLYRLDFSGQLSTSSVEGYLILDYTTVDVDPDPTRGFFPGLVAELDISYNGIRYTIEGPLPIISSTLNRSAGSSIGDIFGIGGGVTNGNGDDSFFAIQFQDLSGTLYASDALPTTLDLADYSLFDPANSFSTGMIIDGISGAEFIPLDFIEFRQVPVPAAGWLLLGALAVSFGLKKRH